MLLKDMINQFCRLSRIVHRPEPDQMLQQCNLFPVVNLHTQTTLITSINISKISRMENLFMLITIDQHPIRCPTTQRQFQPQDLSICGYHIQFLKKLLGWPFQNSSHTFQRELSCCSLLIFLQLFLERMQGRHTKADHGLVIVSDPQRVLNRYCC